MGKKVKFKKNCCARAVELEIILIFIISKKLQ